MANEYIQAILETLYMVSLATFFSVFFGFLLAIAMVLTGQKEFYYNPALYKGIDFSVNLLRSFPFIILLIAIIPLTRYIVGTSIGSTATIVPLTFAATPFVARIMETSLLEVDRGIIEATRSFGATNWQIITRVMVREALPTIVQNIAVVTISLLGYSAMAGAVGGGGLGNLAIQYGYNRFQTDVMIYSVLILIVIVQIVQSVGSFLYKKLR